MGVRLGFGSQGPWSGLWLREVKKSERAADAPPHAEMSAVRQPRMATTRRRGVMQNVTSREGRVRVVVCHGR